MIQVRKYVLSAAAGLLLLIPISASATTVTLETFTLAAFNDVADNAIAVEDFESYTAGIWNPATITQVGTFSPYGGSGSGSTCGAQSGVPCTKLYLSDAPTNGQDNIVPVDGTNSLSANDTEGVIWNAFAGGGQLFNKIVIAFSDAADIRGTTFKVETGSTSATLTGAANANEQLAVFNFDYLVGGATVNMFNMFGKTNDSVNLDGAVLANVATIPLPAAGWLLLAGIGGLAALRRRKTA